MSTQQLSSATLRPLKILFQGKFKIKKVIKNLKIVEFLISWNFLLDADMIEMAGISDISDLTGGNVMNLVDLVLATDPERFPPQREK